MDEFLFVKTAYQYYLGPIIMIATYLTVSNYTHRETLTIGAITYLFARTLGKWHFRNPNSGINRQHYMAGKYSPPWQTLFRVLWMLSEDKPEARAELEKWIQGRLPDD